MKTQLRKAAGWLLADLICAPLNQAVSCNESALMSLSPCDCSPGNKLQMLALVVQYPFLKFLKQGGQSLT